MAQRHKRGRTEVLWAPLRGRGRPAKQACPAGPVTDQRLIGTQLTPAAGCASHTSSHGSCRGGGGGRLSWPRVRSEVPRRRQRRRGRRAEQEVTLAVQGARVAARSLVRRQARRGPRWGPVRHPGLGMGAPAVESPESPGVCAPAPPPHPEPFRHLAPRADLSPGAGGAQPAASLPGGRPA